ncbi:hypothetical protein ACP70R_008040 [Stipagrostis hirtigluma subsp. patula]
MENRGQRGRRHGEPARGGSQRGRRGRRHNREQERGRGGGPAGDPQGLAPRDGAEGSARGGVENTAGGGGGSDSELQGRRREEGNAIANGGGGTGGLRGRQDDGAQERLELGAEVQGRPRAGEERNASGGGGTAARRGRDNGDAEQKRPHLGGSAGELQGRQRDGGGAGTGGRRGRNNGDADQEKVDLGGEQAIGHQRSGAAGEDGGFHSGGLQAQPDGAAATSYSHSGRPWRGTGYRPPTLLPWSNFLSDSILAWTIKDVLDDELYINEVQKVPAQFKSNEQFIDVHSSLLLEETRSLLCSAVRNMNKREIQFCRLLSIEKTDFSFGYFLDIDLAMTRSDDIQCRHIAQDFDVCLLSLMSPLDSGFDVMSSFLAIVSGVGRDTFFQRSFRVLVSNSEKFHPENVKFVSFLTNIKYRMVIASILSIRDERDDAAVGAVLELYKKIGRKCNTCARLPPCKVDLDSINQKEADDTVVISDLTSSLQCTHQCHTEVVWAPPIGLKGCIAAMLKNMLHESQRLLICVASVSSLSDIMVDLKDLSISPDVGDVVVLNNISGLENCRVFEKFTLEHQSQELYCCLLQCKSWLKGMTSLLDLSGYYHKPRCAYNALCERCRKSGLLEFSISTFTKRFDIILEHLLECLVYLNSHAATFSLLDRDNGKIVELMNVLKQLKALLHNECLRDDGAEKAFGLLPDMDITSDDSPFTIEASLNEERMKALRLIDSLSNLLVVPQLENRDEIEIFCIKHSRIIVSTLDCTWQLYGLEMDPFDILIVHGAGQIKEDELLVPLVLPVRHTVLFGDHLHVQPVVHSKACKEAGYGASIFEKLRQMVPQVQMLKHQFAVHPFISRFPNNYFYSGKLEDGPNVKSIEYNREFVPLKLPFYGFIDIPATALRPTSKDCVYSAAIYQLLQQFCKEMVNANREFSIGVVCLSSNHSNKLRDQLRSKREIHDSIHLQVKCIDSLQEEYFDVIILSMFVEHEIELKHIRKNNWNVALLSSRHCFWMVSEYNAFAASGEIWISLMQDAKERGCVIVMDQNRLSEVTKQFENDEGHCTDSNSVLSSIITHMPGQELTWAGRPYRTKYVLAPVRDQRGQMDTCSFQSCSGAVESLIKIRNASLEPPQDFTWTFLLDDWKIQYKNIVSKPFGSEEKASRGTKRLQSTLDIYKDTGVLACNESVSKVRRFKISSYVFVDPNKTEDVRDILENGGIMVGYFRLSRNYYSLRPNQVYVFDEERPIIHPKSELVASHVVMMIGIGHRQTGVRRFSRHMAMQNSEGKVFGINGFGRVGKKTVRGLYRIEVPNHEVKKPAL